MANTAQRDYVWDAALRALVENPAGIRRTDVEERLEVDVNTRTVRRVLLGMKEVGWFDKEREGGHFYYPGTKARENLRILTADDFARVRGPDNDRRPDEDGDTEPTTNVSSRATREGGTPDERIENAIREWGVGGEGELRRRREEALRLALEYVREHGQATSGELREEVGASNLAGYKNTENWWNNFVYQAFRELELVDNGGGTGRAMWLWVEG